MGLRKVLAVSDLDFEASSFQKADGTNILEVIELKEKREALLLGAAGRVFGELQRAHKIL